eukprot:1141997_1
MAKAMHYDVMTHRSHKSAASTVLRLDEGGLRLWLQHVRDQWVKGGYDGLLLGLSGHGTAEGLFGSDAVEMFILTIKRMIRHIVFGDRLRLLIVLKDTCNGSLDSHAV